MCSAQVCMQARIALVHTCACTNKHVCAVLVCTWAFCTDMHICISMYTLVLIIMFYSAKGPFTLQRSLKHGSHLGRNSRQHVQHPEKRQRGVSCPLSWRAGKLVAAAAALSKGKTGLLTNTVGRNLNTENTVRTLTQTDLHGVFLTQQRGGL